MSTDHLVEEARRRAAAEFDAAEHRYRERSRTVASQKPERRRPADPDAPLPRLLAPAVRRAD
ncbi:hypothetical protein [Gordonia malaquae]|uniref:hypothetical protein n=1 Tax=Gordonia malaquae TaxID=410332 RepID=UPI00058F82B7|nr:hypothetical protein [Gordonia malaquae]